jgi:SPP1 gp7 family putative phage head morphogenesis protein
VDYYAWASSRANLDQLIALGRAAWKNAPLQKAANDVPDAAAVSAALQTQIAADQFSRGAMALYVGLALDTAEEVGQLTLDALGLNRTFAWAHQRAFARDAFAVRGSKIIHHAHGYHVDRLAEVVVRACNPTRPLTIGDLTKEIRTQWADVSRKNALRVARTESANVWERTNWYAMRANGVKQVQWIIATGPAIGNTVEPVCEICLQRKVESPYVMDDMVIFPPVHPNCRCTLVPKLDPTWLPPAEPWTGGESPLPPIFLDEVSKALLPTPGVARTAPSPLAHGWLVGTGWGR